MTDAQFHAEIALLVDKFTHPPDPAPFTRLIIIGQRLAQRIVTGQAGDGIDRDAQLFLDQMAELPDELRVLL
jgi:hypothetical protein